MKNYKNVHHKFTPIYNDVKHNCKLNKFLYIHSLIYSFQFTATLQSNAQTEEKLQTLLDRIIN